MKHALLVMLAACGPGLAVPDRKPELRNALVEASGDPAAIAKMLRGSVIDGGLWFVDRDCRLQFPHAEQLQDTQLQPFASCLAGLHWQASPRRDELGDVIVLTYAPGFEIEVRVVVESWGPRIAWVGSESQRGDNDGSPTITAAAFEALRTSGDRNGPLAPEVASKLELDQVPLVHGAFAWLKVCIDTTGAVASVDPRSTTSSAAASAFTAAANTWTFKPFVVADQPLSVCAMLRPVYPANAGPKDEALPLPAPRSRSKKQAIVLAAGAKVLEANRIAGEKQIYPDDHTKSAIQAAGSPKLIGSFRICLDDTGHPESILPLHPTGVAAYDRELIAGMQRWVYLPMLVNGEPFPVCTAVTFIYTQR